MRPPVRVLIADDHPIVRDGIAHILAPHSTMTVVGTADSFAAIRTVLEQHGPHWVDVILLDLSGMRGSPLQFVETMHRCYPSIALIVFSSHVDFAPELFERGVRGYLCKEELSSHMVRAIEQVRYAPFVSPIVQDYLDRAASVARPITPAELQTLKLLAHGYSTTDIADYMGIDQRTSQNYITKLRHKLGATERAQMVLWYHRMYGEQA